MTGADYTIERLALQYGRVIVKGGYADGLIRVTAGTKEHLVNEDGNIVKVQANMSAMRDWASLEADEKGAIA